jgi:hypothetical protein
MPIYNALLLCLEQFIELLKITQGYVASVQTPGGKRREWVNLGNRSCSGRKPGHPWSDIGSEMISWKEIHGGMINCGKSTTLTNKALHLRCSVNF